jgi:hypothetical protein
VEVSPPSPILSPHLELGKLQPLLALHCEQEVTTATGNGIALLSSPGPVWGPTHFLVPDLLNNPQIFEWLQLGSRPDKRLPCLIPNVLDQLSHRTGPAGFVFILLHAFGFFFIF